ncbi:MAG: hypothetical protein JSW51_01230 [Gemmatimonadota bacterium]|nr:MAG: hypothetical protein JSW51_01230 [Gemmatimonadota bacterium]
MRFTDSHRTLYCLIACTIGVSTGAWAQDSSMPCIELGECRRMWLSDLGYGFGLDAPTGAARQNVTWEAALLQPWGDRKSAVGVGSYLAINFSGNFRLGLKARARSSVGRMVLDIGLGLLAYESSGTGLGATGHIGLGIVRSLMIRVSAEVYQRELGRSQGDFMIGLNWIAEWFPRG